MGNIDWELCPRALQDLSSNKCIASSNKCLTSSNKKLLGTSVSYRLTSSVHPPEVAVVSGSVSETFETLVTRKERTTEHRSKKLLVTKGIATSNKDATSILAFLLGTRSY